MALPQNYLTKLVELSANISAGQSISDIINVFGASVLALILPMNFTSSTVTFDASQDGINFYSLVDGYTGNPLQLICGNNTFARILPADLVGVQALKIKTSAIQASDVVIKVVCGPLL